MPLNFPTNPTTNQTYTFNSVTWVWTGTRWEVQSSGSGNYYMGWISSDPRSYTNKNNTIYANASTGGNIDYDTVNAVGGYPDQIGVGFSRTFSEGQNVGNIIHINFNYV